MPMGSDQVADVDILIVGAGVTGIYQLYRALEAGYSAQLVEAGSGVGGTWYWNRYPGARYDSESYTYGYLFSEELFAEWDWTEHFAGQPENERYFNHVVDKFDLRRHIRFNTKVTSAVWDQSTETWLVKADGYAARARYVVAATGVLSVPFYPPSPAGTASAARPTTPACGRRPRSISRASASPSSAPGRAASRSSRWSRPRSPR